MSIEKHWFQWEWLTLFGLRPNWFYLAKLDLKKWSSFERTILQLTFAYSIFSNVLRVKKYFAETLTWRRVADLYVLVGTTFCTMLGWILLKEGITDIFQQEEGR